MRNSSHVGTLVFEVEESDRWKIFKEEGSKTKEFQDSFHSRITRKILKHEESLKPYFFRGLEIPWSQKILEVEDFLEHLYL